MNEQLKSDLTSADPAAGGDDAELNGLLHRLSADARSAATSKPVGRIPWWKRRRVLIPVGIVGAFALTGAAVLIPLGQLSVNEIPVDYDAEIPIVYTTDTGVDVSCRFGIYFGDPAERTTEDERLATFVREHDWSDIGQRIYDEAITHPFVPGPDDKWEVDTPELRDRASFSRATEVIWDEIPEALMYDGWSSGASMTCKGQLH